MLIAGTKAKLAAWKRLVTRMGSSYQVVGQSRNLRNSHRLLLGLKPDILLAETALPDGSVLGMLEPIRAQLPDLQIIFTSTDISFPSVRAALRLGASDYLLQPGEDILLSESLLRAGDRQQSSANADDMQQNRKLRMKAQLLSLLTNASSAGQGVQQMMENAGLASTAYYVMILQPSSSAPVGAEIYDRIDSMLLAGYHAVSVILYDALVVFVMCENTDLSWRNEAAEIVTRMEELLPQPFYAGVSELKQSRHQIRESYQQARQALVYGMHDAPDMSRVFYRNTRRALITTVLAGNDKIQDAAEDVFRELIAYDPKAAYTRSARAFCFAGSASRDEISS